MGTITRGFANNINSSGILKPAAFNNDSFDNVTAVPSGSVETGSMVFIKKLTASSSATLSFVDGSNGVVLDDTYKEYLFYFVDIHPSTDGVDLSVNFSTDGGSNYNVTKTTTYFQAYHNENDSVTSLEYDNSKDLAQSTSFQKLANAIGNDNDEITVGSMTLFNPSSTTFVKHFMSRFNISNNSNYSVDNYVAGYGNTTSSINAVQFKMHIGNIDAGDICLYGIA
jgi:hypothetical protein